MRLLADAGSSVLLRRGILKSIFQRPLLPLQPWLFLLWAAGRAVRLGKKPGCRLWQLVPVAREWYSLGEMQKCKMVGDGLAEVVNIPAKHSCEQKAGQALAPRRFFSLLRIDEAHVLCAVLTVAANTPVDMNMNRFQVPSDKRLITLLNYSLFFF